MTPKLKRLAALLLLALLAGCEVSVEEDPQSAVEVEAEVDSPAPAVVADPPIVPPSPAAPAVQHAPSSRVARGKLRFIEGYQQGYQHALQAGKPMLVFFTAEWCRFCHQMADEAFTNQQVVNLSERFVCILVDADAEPEVCRQFRVQGYPTVQFLSPRGVPLNRIVGKKPGHQVVMSMQAALQNVARRDQAGSETTIK